MRDFYVYKRSDKKNYYVQFRNPLTGKLGSSQTTGKKDYVEALQEASRRLYAQGQSSVVSTVREALLSNNLSETELAQLQTLLNIQATAMMQPQSIDIQPSEEKKLKSRTPFLQWLTRFWEYETSDYVQDKLSHGKKVSKRYCYDQTLIIKYWAEFFSEDTMLEDIELDDLQDFENFLWERKAQKRRTVVDEKTGKKHVELYYTQLSTKTRNNIIKCASIAFEWAVRKKLVFENPCKGLTAYSVVAEKRDILNRQEVGLLFTQGTWKDERARVASLVAMTTGLRISEILALQESDIGEDRLFISRSWSSKDGLTTTKNGESRIVPLVPEVKKELYKLHFQNPYGENGGKFIFFGTLPDKPVVSNVITEDFKQAMESIGISEEQRQKRNIVFHSWRHFYATTIATELSEKHAQLTLGHLTQAMTKHYADHKTEEALMSVCNASNEIFMNMLHA